MVSTTEFRSPFIFRIGEYLSCQLILFGPASSRSVIENEIIPSSAGVPFSTESFIRGPRS